MRYSTAAASRRALEERLKTRVDGDPARIGRDRKRVVFDRLLARLALVAPGTWVLKGGFALDLRLGEAARTTRDIDVAWRAGEEQVLDVLVEAAAGVAEVRPSADSRRDLSAPRRRRTANLRSMTLMRSRLSWRTA